VFLIGEDGKDDKETPPQGRPQLSRPASASTTGGRPHRIKSGDRVAGLRQIRLNSGDIVG